MSRIRTFALQEAPEPAPVQPPKDGPAPDADEDVAEPLPAPPLTLALARKGSSYILVHPAPMSASAPNERQYAIINALVQADPFPELGEGGRSRLWLKIGAGKSGEQGGENEGLLEKLVAAGVVKETGTTAKQGIVDYPLVELLLPSHELCHACACCGAFETQKEEDDVPTRFLRCARCKQAYYCSALCQSKDWKATHKPNCLDVPGDDDASIEEARRRALLRLFGRTVAARVGPRSKMD
ncbi:hypothetical protein BCR35DRAFT_353236 [Leucosporidium creatinivorum]|uniref:MYND-type domain-containing protein n=1 Tax=Leucosporidium creatinivorum TaxID=106004 RepID=A0A1Y2EYZ4_9BASI|nr:hypothetical protein BCR35DRAFT_353236 [Leucosporidium creatinivorum]